MSIFIIDQETLNYTPNIKKISIQPNHTLKELSANKATNRNYLMIIFLIFISSLPLFELKKVENLTKVLIFGLDLELKYFLFPFSKSVLASPLWKSVFNWRVWLTALNVYQLIYFQERFYKDILDITNCLPWGISG